MVIPIVLGQESMSELAWYRTGTSSKRWWDPEGVLNHTARSDASVRVCCPFVSLSSTNLWPNVELSCKDSQLDAKLRRSGTPIGQLLLALTIRNHYFCLHVHRSLSKSFEAEYRGAAVDAFYEYLTHNMKLFKTAPGPRYFAKVCPMIHSSGTGKSRLLLEVTRYSSHMRPRWLIRSSVVQKGCHGALQELGQ